MRHRKVPGSRFTHICPAGLPSGIPGIGEEMDAAMQHAPHPGRHVMRAKKGVVLEDEHDPGNHEASKYVELLSTSY